MLAISTKYRAAKAAAKEQLRCEYQRIRGYGGICKSQKNTQGQCMWSLLGMHACDKDLNLY